jgi:hypothetical protein
MMTDMRDGTPVVARNAACGRNAASGPILAEIVERVEDLRH